MPVSDYVLRAGGRRIGYRLFGADARPALLYLHGAPGSRAEVGLYELGLLEERGVCAVAVDRPGYGATDPLDDLDRLARVKDAVAVTEHVGMAHFVVQGTSAGGQYAFAFSVAVPDRVQAVILTAAGGRISEEGLEGMAEEFADGWRQGWRDPKGARARLEAEVAELRLDPMAVLRQWTGDWPADERDWLEDNSKALSEDMAEATRQGPVGYLLDGVATSQPWQFDLTEIRAPIHVFHGDGDTMAPWPLLRRTLAGAATVKEERIYPGGNHLSPWVTRDRQAAMLSVIPG